MLALMLTVMLASLTACDGAGAASDPSVARTEPRPNAERHAEVPPAAEMPAPAPGWVPPRSLQVGDTRCTLSSAGHLRCGPEADALRLMGVVEIVSDGAELCARTTDGSAFCGAGGAVTRVEGVVGVRQVVVARGHACFLGNDRRVRCRAPGARATRVARLEGAVEIAANDTDFFARTRDGHVARWPVLALDGPEARAMVPPISDARAIAARGGRFCAARGNSAAVVCANPAPGDAMNDRPHGLQAVGLDGALALGLMDDGGCALAQDDALVCWGRIPETNARTGATHVGTAPAGGYLRCGAEHCCIAAPGVPTACVGHAPDSPREEASAEAWVLTQRSSAPTPRSDVEPPAGP